MTTTIQGLHHITAIANNAKRNHDFYTKVLGVRLVKKTVNFDDPGTYHFYFGNETGAPGTILTFFPWEGIGKGNNGAGMATEIRYSVPTGSLPFWQERFRQLDVRQQSITESFGQPMLPFEDPDGLQLALVEVENDDRIGWQTPGITAAQALKGFHSVVLLLNEAGPTAAILTEVFGYRLQEKSGNRYRYIIDAVATAAVVEIQEVPQAAGGRNAAGTNHHIAFRVADEDTLMSFREKILARGISITHKINRDYFFSLYFREPGGVLFEIATDNPGFATDETLEELGTSLQLPDQYEAARDKIEQLLPKL